MDFHTIADIKRQIYKFNLKSDFIVELGLFVIRCQIFSKIVCFEEI